MICKKCGSDKFWKRGHSWQCKKCKSWNEVRPQNKQGGASSSFSATSEGKGEYTATVTERITTLEQLIRICEIDLENWEIERWVCNKWEVGAKNINKEIVIEPLFQVKVWLVRKVVEIEATRRFNSLIESAKTFAPKYPKISYPEIKDGLLFEIGLPDMQLGRMVMGESTGWPEDLTPESMIEKADKIVNTLLSHAFQYPISRILFPIGNDFYDVDNLEMTTTHGTVQQDDPRWQRVFRLGQEFTIRTIDKLTPIAPVDVVVVPGNHDETKMFYLGGVLEAWYHNNPDVTVDNSTKLRKYYAFEKNLIGLTHGYHEKYGELPSLMAYEQPQLWANSLNREWHLGDKHHKKDILFKTEELRNGVVVRILRSIASPSVWEDNKGFVGSLKAAEGFLWHPEHGVIAQFTARE